MMLIGRWKVSDAIDDFHENKSSFRSWASYIVIRIFFFLHAPMNHSHQDQEDEFKNSKESQTLSEFSSICSSEDQCMQTLAHRYQESTLGFPHAPKLSLWEERSAAPDDHRWLMQQTNTWWYREELRPLHTLTQTPTRFTSRLTADSKYLIILSIQLSHNKLNSDTSS